MSTFLIADDHELVRRGLRSLVRKNFPGTQIEEACDAGEAMEMARAVRPDLVLLDIRMPSGDGLDGMDALRSIRGEFPQMPVLIISAVATDAYASRAFRAGASGYVSKTADASEIVEAIRTVLGGEPYAGKDISKVILSSLGQEGRSVHELLTDREMQVFQRIAMDKSVRAIAADLGISEKTVAVHRANIYEKTGLDSPVAITRYALHHGLCD